MEQQRPINSGGGNSPNTTFDTFDSLLVYSADSMAIETNDNNNGAIIIVVPRIQYNKNELTTPILGDPIKRQGYEEAEMHTIRRR